LITEATDDDSLRMVIYGFPGSGKTGLINGIRKHPILKNYKVIDTDDFSDARDTLTFKATKDHLVVEVFSDFERKFTRGYVTASIVLTNRIDAISQDHGQKIFNF
jgi:GTPase SAR1 family protein